MLAADTFGMRLDGRLLATSAIVLALSGADVVPARPHATPTEATSNQAVSDDLIVRTVKPSEADPAIHGFDQPAYVLFAKTVGDAAQLALFLPGTHGKPNDLPMLRLVAGLGYRVVALQYNDDISVNPICPKAGAPDCSEHFRADRIFGDDRSEFTHTPPAETISNRLTKTLQYLEAHFPQEHWGDYLENGEPKWSRFVVTGLSQGAGMAALIAKRHEVARVVLFSAPADFVFDAKVPHKSRPADWLSRPGATPSDRWYAEYHAREQGAERLQDAYAALGIPADHILVFDLDLQPGAKAKGDNPFHPNTIRNPGYEPQWKALFGHSLR